ncbi:MAG: DUF5703 domain-containing protein [Eubacteriales bacterium]
MKARMEDYNISWDTQSECCVDSMPVGGHSIGANVWVENNELFMYVQQSGWFDENNSMLKFGRIRMAFEPNIFEEHFKQTLKYSQGYVEICGGDNTINIWVDAQYPVVHVEGSGKDVYDITVTYETWRSEERVVPSNSYELFQCKDKYLSPYEDAIFYADEIRCESDTITVRHQNKNDKLSIYKLIENQEIEELLPTLYNPQKDLISGGYMGMHGFTKGEKTKGQYIKTPYVGYSYKGHMSMDEFAVHMILHSDYYPDVTMWEDKIEEIKVVALEDTKKRFEETKKWWANFYEKSYIHIGESPEDELWELGRNYNLFQYMLASNYYGYWPTKFNGGLFTFDPDCIGYVEWSEERLAYTPDYRLWGGGAHTIQNQRLVYWPMLRTGDASVMEQQFNMMNRALVNAKLRTKLCFGCEGAVYPEQMGIHGLSNNEDNGWDNCTGWPEKEHIRYLFTNSLEISYMMIKYHQYTGADIEKYMEFIHAILAFYNDFYSKNDQNGKMILYPAGCMETYANVKNPVDAVSGIQAVLEALINLDVPYISDEKREFYKLMLQRVPEIKHKKEAGCEIIAYADSKGILSNCEIPETYPIHPFERYGIGKPNLQVAKDTVRIAQRTEEQKSHVSWHTTGVVYARCGMVEESVDFLKKKIGNGPHRFPSFWGPGHDWTPDFNWGGSGCMQLQDMLLQEQNGCIYLLPCWPEGKAVAFKMHCMNQGVITCEYDGTNITEFKVEPLSLIDKIVFPK